MMLGFQNITSYISTPHGVMIRGMIAECTKASTEMSFLYDLLIVHTRTDIIHVSDNVPYYYTIVNRVSL